MALGSLSSLVRTDDGTVHATGYVFYGQNGTGVGGARVRVVGEETVPLGAVRVADDGRWSLSLPAPLDLGEHTFRVTSEFGSTARSTVTAVTVPQARLALTPRVTLVDRIA